MLTHASDSTIVREARETDQAAQQVRDGASFNLDSAATMRIAAPNQCQIATDCHDRRDRPGRMRDCPIKGCAAWKPVIIGYPHQGVECFADRSDADNLEAGRRVAAPREPSGMRQRRKPI